MATAPKPIYEMRCYPKRNDGEVDTEYQKRVLQFMKEHHYPKKQQDEWEKDKCLTFRLPQDVGIFQKFMQDNPSASLTLQCPSRDGLREGMSMLRGINPDLIKNVAQAVFADDPQGSLQGRSLENEKFKLFPHLKGPRHPGT